MNEALIAKLGLDRAGFDAGLKAAAIEAQKAQEKMAEDAKRIAAKRREEAKKEQGEHLNQASEGVSRLGESVLAAAGISLGIEGLVEMGKSAIETARHIKDFSEETGISAQKVQSLGYAFSQNGASQETFEKGMAKLTQNMGEARNGNTALVDTFNKLGVTWADLNQDSPDKVFSKIIDYGEAAGDTTQRLALYMEVLGKAGRQLAPGMNKGADAIKELESQFSGFSDEQLETIEKSGQAWARWGKGIELVFGQITSEVVAFNAAHKTASEANAGIPQKHAPEARTILSGGGGAAVENLPVAKEREVREERFRGPYDYEQYAGGKPYGPKTKAEDDAEIKAEKERHARDLNDATPTTAKGDKTLKQPEWIQKALGEEAGKGINTALQGVKTEEGNSDNDNDNDARRLGAAKAIKAIQNESDYAHMQALASIIGQTSKLAALDQEDALTQRQIADAKEKMAAESDDTKKAAIAKEISALENKGLETDEKRVELQLRLADAAQEIEFSLQQQNIDRLKGLSAASDVLAREQEIDLIGKRIAKNSADMKNADELRTLELRRQNVELRTSQQILEAANKAKYMADHEKTPQDLNAQHAEDHKKETLGKAWERAQERKRRHEAGLDGSAQPDVGNRSVQPKNYRSQDDPSKHSPILPKGVGKSTIKLPPMDDHSFKPGGKRWDGKPEDPLHPGHTTMPPTHMPDRSFTPYGKTWNRQERPDAPEPKPEPYFPGYKQDTLHPGSGLSSSGAGKVDFKEVLTALGRIEQSIQKVGEDV